MPHLRFWKQDFDVRLSVLSKEPGLFPAIVVNNISERIKYLIRKNILIQKMRPYLSGMRLKAGSKQVRALKIHAKLAITF